MPKIKSICLLSVHTCPVAALGGKKTGGMNVYVRDLARELGAHGIKVDIFTRCFSKDAAEIHRLGKNVRVIHIPCGPAKDLIPHKIYPHLNEFTDNVLAYKEKAKSAYDLIHSHYWLSGLVGEKLASHWQIPHLLTFHTLGATKEKYTHRPEFPPRLRHEAELIKSVKHILGFTPAETYATHIIPPGTDLNRFHPIPRSLACAKLGLNPDKKYLLFVGRPDPIKNLPLLKKSVPFSVTLITIGGKNQKDQRILPYYYSVATTTVMPSAYESFGLVALESMACATPVIASRIGGLQYLVGSAGILIPPNNLSALTQAISKLLNNYDLRSKISNLALARSQHYSWSKIIPKILRLYESLV